MCYLPVLTKGVLVIIQIQGYFFYCKQDVVIGYGSLQLNFVVFWLWSLDFFAFILERCD